MRESSLPLARVFRTTEELNEPELAEVVGEIPPWVQGTFLRSGPGLFDLKNNFQMKHIFDGYAVLSKFEISQGQVTFTKKFLESDAFKRAKAIGRPTVCEYGTRGYPDPGKGWLARFIPNVIPPLSDNCNLCTFQLGGKLFASSETSYFREFDMKTLKTGDREKHDTMKLYGLNSLSCHPLTDESGVTYNIGPSMMTGLKHNVIRIPPTTSLHQSADEMLKKGTIIASIPSSWNGLLSFNHSFAMTKNYIVIIEQPYVYVLSKVIGGVLTKNLSIRDWLDWRTDLTNNFLILEKSTGKVVKTQFSAATPFFFLHVINAYEDKGNIVIDISTFPTPSVLHGMTVENLRNGAFTEADQPQGARYVLPMVNNGIEIETGVNLLVGIKSTAQAVKVGGRIVLTPEILTEPGLDLPIINRNYLGRKYSYYYVIGFATYGVWRNTIAKVRTVDHKILTWRRSNSYYVGEPVFVPNPNGKEEDDGVILSSVITDGKGDAGRDFLLILDARTMEELGRAYVNCQLPLGVHGIFVPS